MPKAVLGINAVFHDPAAALVVDGRTVAAAEEERFSRRKHGKEPVPFSTWELPERAARWCLEHAGLAPENLDAVAYSYDPDRASPSHDGDLAADGWEDLRTLYCRRAPRFLQTALPGLRPDRVSFVPHHLAHAASAYHASGLGSCAVLTLDGRGETTSALAGHFTHGALGVMWEQSLPHSLGLVYESLTAHLGFRRASDEYKVMALASYGRPRWQQELESVMRPQPRGFRAEVPDWSRWASPIHDGAGLEEEHADLAASVQRRLEDVLLELAGTLHARTGERALVLAGGVALNCVANSRLWRDSPFEEIWVQPAAGDSGTALGAAMHVAHELGDRVQAMPTAALGRGWNDEELESRLDRAALPYERPRDVAAEAAEVLAANGVVAWFDGRAEFGPRALGQRSLLADPREALNLERLNDVKGREQFRPVAPMVLADRAHQIFDGGPLPSPYMLFTHRVKPPWVDRIPAVVHVDGSARIQTVGETAQPRLARMLKAFERLTGVPVVVNTSLNTAGRPMVDDPRDALELFGSAPVDALVMGPFLLRRPGSEAASRPELEEALA